MSLCDVINILGSQCQKLLKIWNKNLLLQRNYTHEIIHISYFSLTRAYIWSIWVLNLFYGSPNNSRNKNAYPTLENISIEIPKF